MKRIGLLGGMNWESSIEHKRIINETVRQRLGGLHSADQIIRPYDFDDIEALQADSAWAEAGRVLTEGARTLEAAGAEIIVLCTNTMHRVADSIEGAISVPFLTSPTPPRRLSSEGLEQSPNPGGSPSCGRERGALCQSTFARRHPQRGCHRGCAP